MKLLDWLERFGIGLFFLAALIYVPPAYEEYRRGQAISNYNVRDIFDPRSVSVGNAVQGEPIPIGVERTIYEVFHGTWIVEVREFPTMAAVCTATEALRYTPEATLPEGIDLTWWTNGDPECNNDTLPPGEYVVVTTWIVHNDLPDVPDQSITVVSNPFSIYDKEIIEQRELKDKVKEIQRQLEDS